MPFTIFSWVGLRLVALGAVASALTGPARAGDDEAALYEAAKKRPPMEFVVFKGGPNACGVGCDSWIAAEGRIVGDAPGPDGRLEEGTTTKLIKLLAQLDGRKLPIYFRSTGGDIVESLALGRVLRDRKLSAGVATTLPANCVANTVEECQKSMFERPEAVARLWSEGVLCGSGCAYAILGAAVREIAVRARVGVHSFLVDPNATEARRTFTAAAIERRIQAYLTEVGIGAEFYKIAAATRFDSAHVLTRAELYDLGIDRRETVDAGWILGNVDSRKGFVLFDDAEMKISEAGGDNLATSFKRLALVIGCPRPRRGYLLAVSEPLLEASAKSSGDVRVSAGSINLTLNGRVSVLTSQNGVKIQQWQEPITKGVLETLLASPAIKVSELQRRNRRQRQITDVAPPEFAFSNVRGAEALKAIVSRCGSQK